MINALAQLLDVSTALLWQSFAVFIRVGATVSLLPAFGEQAVPMRIKLGVGVAFTMIIAPAVAAPDLPPVFDNIVWLIVTEIAVGLMLGIGLRLFVMALQTAGSIAGQSTSLAQILGSAMAEPVPAMGHILVIGALALAVMSGLHVKAAEFVILSYDMLPMGRLPNGADLSEWGVNQVRRAFTLAFTLAAPFVVLSVLYNLALGVINKAMPQLMVAFVGAPVIMAGGLLLLTLSAPLILTTWIAALDSFLAAPFQAVP